MTMHYDTSMLTFSYTSLDPVTSTFVQQKATECQGLLKRSAQDILLIGNHLLAVKACLPYESFLVWLRTEVGITERNARNFMHVARRFSACTEWIEDLSPSVLFELAAPSTSEAILHQVATKQLAPTRAAIRAAKKADRLQQHFQRLSSLMSKDNLTTALHALQQKFSAPPSLPLSTQEKKQPGESPAVPEQPTGVSPAPHALLPASDNHNKENEVQDAQRTHDLPSDVGKVQNGMYHVGYQQWQEAIALLVKDLDHCLIQWPTLQDKQEVVLEDWSQLWQVQSLAHQVLERCFQWTQSLALDQLVAHLEHKAKE